jgi:DNA-binding NarL/FixJ family response regulator
MTAPRIRIAVVDDEPAIRLELRRLLEQNPRFRVVATLPSGEAALRHLAAQPAEVVLMDLHLPGLSGSDCIRRLKEHRPELTVVVLTKFEDPDHLFEALKAGANGYLLKTCTATELEAAVLQARDGGAPLTGEIAARVLGFFHRLGSGDRKADGLTPRERDVLDLLAQGFAYKEIARRLGLSGETVNSYVKTIYRKLNVHSAVEAARFARGG